MRLPSQGGPNKKRGHYDPFHLHASYLSAASPSAFEVEVRLVKQGRGFSNLEARLIQPSHKTGRAEVRISTHVIMTSFASRRADNTLGPTIPTEHPLFPKCPLRSEEACTDDAGMRGPKVNMRDRIRFARDYQYGADGLKDGHLQWGGWFSVIREDRDKTDTLGVGNNLIPLFADMMQSPVNMLPKIMRPPVSWYPTMAMAIDFKRELPWDAPLLRAGLVAKGKFIVQGQHEHDNEIWSHPGDAQRLGLPADAGPQILAIARQVALTLDLSINAKQNSGSAIINAKL